MTCGRTRQLAAALALGTAAGSLPGPLAAQVDPDRELVSIEFEGNNAFSASELKTAILAEETSCRSFLFIVPLPICPLTDWGFAHDRGYLDESELPLDALRLKLFYRQRGYREAEADTVVERLDGEAAVTFRITESEPTRIASLRIEGTADVLDTARVRREFPLQPGDLLDLIALGTGERAITERLRRRGYINATVLREYFIPSGTREAEVVLRVEPGVRARLGEIRIEGAGEIGEDVVREFLRFGEGDWFDTEAILESQRSLYDLPALRYANVATERREETDSVVDLRVQVAPAPLRTLRTGIGMSTDECGVTDAEFTHRNFLGGARVLRAQGRLSNIAARRLDGRFPCTGVGEADVFRNLNFRLQTGFEQPVFSKGRNTLTANLFWERETVPDLFVRSGVGGELAFNRRLRPGMRASVAYRPELTSFAEESADIYFCVNFGFCAPDDIGTLSESRWLSPLLAAWRYDRTDDPFSATRGWYAAVEVERASQFTGSDYRYVRATLDAANFTRLGNDLVLAQHLRFGIIEPTGTVFGAGAAADAVVHPRKRFFAGGPQSVRGFGLNLLGPTVLVLSAADDCPGLDLETCARGLAPTAFDERPEGGNAVVEGSLEARWLVDDRWTVVGFVDIGQVWEDVPGAKLPVATPGIGVRFGSPVGPLRLDLGYDPTGADERPVVAVLESGEIQELESRVLYDPFTFDDPSTLKEFLRRIQLQLSIGEAF